uniref:Uncharacterized protein n=1 Tax=Clastoptera arizonana TaxID=38151 RepID=A0A1B6C189_9HEMI
MFGAGLTICFAVLVVSCTSSKLFETDDMKKILVACAGKEKLNKDEIDMILNHQVPETAKCFASCVMQQSELMDKNGEIDLTALEGMVENIFKDDEEKKQKIMDGAKKCKPEVDAVKTSDSCDKGHLALQCMKKNTDFLN